MTQSPDDSHDPESPDSMTDAVPDDLMQGTDQWWHFLDQKPSEGGEGVEGRDDVGTGLEVEEVSRQSNSRAGLEPAGRSFRCSHCRRENPADLPFCINCGRETHAALHSRTELFVVDGLADDEEARRYVAERLADASEVSREAFDAMLQEEPAFLLIHGYPRKLEALAERLDELGASIETRSPEGWDGDWLRELGESIRRDARQTGLFASVAAATLLGAILWSWWGLLPGMGLLGWLARRRLRWYREHYRIDDTRVLESVSGLERSLASRTRRLLGDLEDSEVGEYLSACLMEHYVIWHRLAPSDALGGVLHERIRRLATELIGEIVDRCESYADLRDILDDADDPETAERLSQHLDLDEIREEADQLRRQMGGMAQSLESLRLRVVATTRRGPEHATSEEVELDTLVDEIETELDVVDETVGDLERATRHSV